MDNGNFYGRYGCLSGTTLASSGTNTYNTTVISTLPENKLLPESVKRMDENGVEKLVQFIYIKKR